MIVDITYNLNARSNAIFIHKYGNHTHYANKRGLKFLFILWIFLLTNIDIRGLGYWVMSVLKSELIANNFRIWLLIGWQAAQLSAN